MGQYVVCTNSPPEARRSVDRSKIDLTDQPAQLQARPNDDGFRAKGGKIRDDYKAGGETYAPVVCEPELTMHGQCVQNVLRALVKKSDSAAFLTPEDKCAHTLGSFSRCIVTDREIKAGRRKEANWDPYHLGANRTGIAVANQ